MNKRVSLFCITFSLIFSLQAQKIEKTSLTIPEMKSEMSFLVSAECLHTSTLKPIGSDEDNYYLHLRLMRKASSQILLMSKDLSNIQRKSISFDERQEVKEIFLLEDNIIVLLTEIAIESVSVFRNVYSKSSCELIEKETIASFEREKFAPYGLRLVKSPDSKKVGFLLFIADKKGKVNNYHATVLNELGEVIWKKTEPLKVRNEVFNIEDAILTNDAEMYITFKSRPQKEKKAKDKKSYLDITYLAEDDANQSSIPFDNFINHTKLHMLRNGNLFVAGVLSASSKALPSQYFNMIFSQKDLDAIGKDSKEIGFTKKSILMLLGFFQNHLILLRGLEK